MAEPFFQIKTIYGAEGEHELPYMTRVIIGRLRLHIFHRGDNDPDPHDHPWDFWTFPLTSYVEEVLHCEGPTDEFGAPEWIERRRQVVPAFRWSFRKAEHTHRVLGRVRQRRPSDPDSPDRWIDIPGPIVTIVWRSKTKRKWGFLKNRDGQWCWVDWRKYIFEGGKHAPCEDDRHD